MTAEDGPVCRQRKFAGLALETVTGSGRFTGYASLFDAVDLGRDAIAPGAFAASLKRRGAAGVKMLFQHDPAEPIGRWLSISEDRRGLRVEGQLSAGVARAREVHALMADGAIDGLSIGFQTIRARKDERTGIRRILEADLWEISVVTFPMLPDARISALKAAERLPSRAPEPAELKTLERAIRRAAGAMQVGPMQMNAIRINERM